MYYCGALSGAKVKTIEEKSRLVTKSFTKKLNKGTSTISGYETEAHEIPLDVLISIAAIFGVSLNELTNLKEPDAISLKDLTPFQVETLVALRNEFLSPTNQSSNLSAQQMQILHDIIKLFSQSS